MTEIDPSTNTPDEATPKSGLTMESVSDTPNLTTGQKIKASVKASQSRRQEALNKFLAAPRDSQRKIVEDRWAELCYHLVNKAMEYQKGITDKEFSKLTSLIISAATAKDKVFHREDAVQKQGNVVFNLFGNVGLDAIKRMLQPPAPKVINLKETHGNEGSS